jgi:hypothetical protein
LPDRRAAWIRWFGPPSVPAAAAPESGRDWLVAGWIFLFAWTVKWFGARWLLAPYDLLQSPWRFGYEAGHIAGNLAAGNGFSVADADGRLLPTAWMSPVYPLLLSWVFRTWGAFSEAAAHATVAGNCLFQAATAGGLFLLGSRIAGRPVGFFAAALFLLNPGGWQFLAWAWPTQLLALSLLAHVAVLWRAGRGATPAVAAACGASLGFAAMVDGAAISFLPVTGLVVWQGAREGAPRAVGAALVAFALVLAPWAARNERVLGTPNPLRGNAGIMLWVGNHPGAREESFHGVRESPWHNRAEGRLMFELGAREYDRRCLERALARIAREPAEFARHTALRFSGFWLAEWWVGYRHIDWIYSAGHVALTALAAAGAWRSRRLGMGFAVAALLLYALPYAITVHGHGRYRVPVEPVLCLLASLAWPRSASMEQLFRRKSHLRD